MCCIYFYYSRVPLSAGRAYALELFYMRRAQNSSVDLPGAWVVGIPTALELLLNKKFTIYHLLGRLKLFHLSLHNLAKILDT